MTAAQIVYTEWRNINCNRDAIRCLRRKIDEKKERMPATAIPTYDMLTCRRCRGNGGNEAKMARVQLNSDGLLCVSLECE